MSARPEVTTLLHAMANGDVQARDALYRSVYAELQRIARASLRKHHADFTLNPATLVHEAFLKLAATDAAALQGSAHFYSLLARAMRQIIIDLGRQRATIKHGVAQIRTALDESLAQEETAIDDLLLIDHALLSLEKVDPELAELVELHFFGGVSFVDIANLRQVNERTVRRHWETARLLLMDAMQGHGRSP